LSAPLVSIVMPVYNAEPFLAETLRSIAAQTYQPTELIAVDDGSTDASVEILRTHPGTRLLRQQNSGPSAARTRAIACAAGEFIAFVDADDVVPPNKLSVQVGYLLDHPEVAATLGRQEWMNPPPGLARDVVWGDLDGVPILSLVARRAVFAEVGEMDEEKGGDLDFLVRMRERGLTFVVLPEIVLHRRYHGGNLVAGRGLAPLPPISLKEKLDRERARARAAGGT
jgi:glycosyltransferase involved in cell wall biosynthesis